MKNRYPKQHVQVIFSLAFLLSLCFPALTEAQILARYPDLNPDGSMIAFSYQGDIWTSDIDGKNAKRWTVHESYDSHPRWNPKGNQISFHSNRYGNNDIFILDLSTGEITQKTFYSSNDVDAAWRPNGQLVFVTDREFQTLEREDEIYGFEKGMATPNRVMNTLGLHAEPSFNDDFWAITKGYCRTSREEYTGPAQQDIWLYNKKDDAYTNISNHDAQDISLRWSESEDFLLSARSGVYNIYKASFKKGKIGDWNLVTEVNKPGIRYFDVSQNGSVIVFERGDGLYRMTDGKISPIDIEVPKDFKFYPDELKTYRNNVSSFSLSANEDYIALEIRGEIFLTQNDKEKSRTVRLTNHPFKDEGATWLNDSTLLYISDREGREKVYQLTSGDEELSDLFWTFETESKLLFERDAIITGISVNPQKTKLLMTSEPGTVELAEIDSNGTIGEFKTILNGWSLPSGISWSPDGNWIAYAQSDLNFNREVFILNVDKASKPINISMHPRSDGSPVWSRDGSKIAFISNRNNGDDDIWFAFLKESDYLKSKDDWEEMDDYPDALKSRLNILPDTSKSENIEIDTEHIHRRLRQVTSYTGDESNVDFDKKGEKIYFVRSNGEDRDLMEIKWDGSDAKKLMSAKGLYGLSLSPKGDHFYYLQRGQVKALKVGGKKPENRPFSAKMKLDFRSEMEQVFEEAWRQLEANFYDPKFHGQDFNKLKKQYKPIALKASTKRDFRDIFNEMIGQINASHMGLYGGNREDVQRISSGKIGAELRATKKGWEIVRVIPKSPADRDESKLMTGDIITQIDGISISADINAYQLLEDKGNERIWLNVLGKDGEERNVYLRCSSSVSGLLYDEWVEERRKLTDKYSNGRLGYIHIQGMNWPSFEAFERELMATGYGKDGIIIDVRYNGGGWTTDMLMTVLNVRQHAYTIPRDATNDLKNHKDFSEYYPYGERLPLSAWTKPSAALCNHTSYSNAEIFSHAFKNLGIGPLVGEPTFGAVISTGGARLMDGSLVRLPFRGWFVKKDGANMDFTPATPDYIVDHGPEVKTSGEDPQLKKAVEVLLESM